MKIRNYLMYWANRLMAPDFKNEYYQANLKQFWESTYPDLWLCAGLCSFVSFLLFPWGIIFSTTHPLYNPGLGFSLVHFMISCSICFVGCLSIERVVKNKIAEKLESLTWLYIFHGLSSLSLQHIFSKNLYAEGTSPLIASLVPVTFFWLGIIIISSFPYRVIDLLNLVKSKLVKGILFIFKDPRTESFRLTQFLEKILGKRPCSPFHIPAKDLSVPKPKDYKIWGVKSRAEKELQKIFDE